MNRHVKTYFICNENSSATCNKMEYLFMLENNVTKSGTRSCDLRNKKAIYKFWLHTFAALW